MGSVWGVDIEEDAICIIHTAIPTRWCGCTKDEKRDCGKKIKVDVISGSTDITHESLGRHDTYTLAITQVCTVNASHHSEVNNIHRASLALHVHLQLHFIISKWCNAFIGPFHPLRGQP